MLTLSYGNNKLKKLADYLGLNKKQVVGFDLPAGYTCKMAKDCKAYADKKTGKIIDSKGMKFRCYAASTEMVFPNSRRAHWRNYNTLRKLDFDGMVALINSSIPENVKVVRIHASGDYFSEKYFLAWCAVAYYRPDITFFGYTKYLEYARYVVGMELYNFKLQYSMGGKQDKYVTKYDPTITVIPSPADAKGLGVACVNNPADDYDYIMEGKSFAIAVHGTQPAKHK
jgi:hypothetical protein